MNQRVTTILLLILAVVFPTTVAADEKQAGKTGNQSKQAVDKKELYEKFEKMMTGVKLSGHFTILGKEKDSLPEEEYIIKSAKKLDKGDYWLLTAQIKYGDKDVTLPIPLEIKWAGDTPVITLTNFNIPSLGVFSSRVVFYNNKYAGTWTHGAAGGHLFGVLEKEDK